MLQYRVTLPGNLIESRMHMNHIGKIITTACDSSGAILYSGSIDGFVNVRDVAAGESQARAGERRSRSNG